MKNFLDMIDDFRQELVSELEDNWTETTAEKLGLDVRASCRRMFVSDQGIAVIGNTRSLDYYGGFEYVDDGCRTSVLDVTFFSIENDRVRRHACKALPAEVARDVSLSYGDNEEDE